MSVSDSIPIIVNSHILINREMKISQVSSFFARVVVFHTFLCSEYSHKQQICDSEVKIIQSMDWNKYHCYCLLTNKYMSKLIKLSH